MDKAKNTYKDYPNWLLTKWQEIADLLAELLCVPSALIMKAENEFMEVFLSSNSDTNPYHVGAKEKWYGLYCETVIKSQNKLSIPNAMKDKNWDKNPDIKLGMIAYLGFPINFPDNKPFGTLCVLDNKERQFSLREEKLLLQFKKVIELDLALIQSFDFKTNKLAKAIKEQQSQLLEKNIELQKAKEKVKQSEKELKTKNEEYKAINEELRQTNDELVLAKEKAEESETRYKSLISNIMYPVIISSFDGNMLYVNQKTADFLGVKPNEIQNLKSPNFWVNPTKRDEYIAELKINGKVQNKEVQFRNNNNEIIITIMSSNIIDYNGQKAIFSIYNDISQRKKAEEALRSSEEKFAKAFNISPDAITLTDIETGEIIDANAGFERVYGYAVKDVIGKTALELNVWADLSSRSELIKILNRDGMVLDFEAKGRRKSGELIHGSISGSIITVGERKMLVITARDITECKQAEKKLQESEEKYRYIVENAPIGIFQRNLEGQFNYCNLTLAKHFECESIDEFLQHYNEISKRWANSDEYTKYKELLVKNGKVLGFETETKLINGKTKWFSLFVDLDSSNSVLNGFSLDITERKKAETALIKNEAHLSTLIDTIPDLVWLKNTDGVYLHCNTRFELLFGTSKENIIGKTDYNFVDKELADFFRNNDKIAIATEKPSKNEEDVIFASDGHTEILETTKTPIYSKDGQIIGVLGIGHDITERKKAEIELENYHNQLEEMVQERTKELSAANEAIEKINKELRESEENFRKLYDLSPVNISITELPSGKFIAVNPAWIKTTGWQLEEVYGRTSLELGIWSSVEQREAFVK
jgi:PAS domain S-box-containing protein